MMSSVHILSDVYLMGNESEFIVLVHWEGKHSECMNLKRMANTGYHNIHAVKHNIHV